MVIVSNGPYFGMNFAVAPEERMDDGLLTVSVFSRYSKLQLWWHFASIAFGRREYSPKSIAFRVARLQVDGPRKLPVHLDGSPHDDLWPLESNAKRARCASSEEQGNDQAATRFHFRDLPDAARSERFEELCRTGSFRIERITSAGQCSAPGFHYDQPWDEWVLVLQGRATIKLEDPEETVHLSRGDWLMITAHRRHRVEATSEAPPTIWLAVHAMAA